MERLDFLQKPEWQIVKKEYINFDKIKSIDEDYWWIDDNESAPELVEPDVFYVQCLDKFAQLACEKGYLRNLSYHCTELIPVGEKVVFEALYDRYLVQRHESDPDIFYNYILSLSVEGGMAISNSWFTDQKEFEEYVDKIIRETSLDDIGMIYKSFLNIDKDIEKIHFIDDLYSLLYDLLKWYCCKTNFEEYKLKAFLAGFYLGVNIIAEKIEV
jgi:hypothetical protein